MKKGKFLAEIYLAPVYYCIGSTEQYARKYFKEQGIKVNEKPWGVGHTLSNENGKNIVYAIWTRNEKDFAVLAHELLHLTGFILSDRSVKYDVDNDEPFTYFIQYLTQEILKTK